MAVKTLIAQQDFIKILSQYELGRYVSHASIIEGTVQSNYRLTTDRGNFLFRLYENRTKKSVLFESSLIKYLTDNAFPCPKIYQNKHLEFVGEFQGKPYVIFEFIEGEHIENPTAGQNKEIVEQIAHLHLLTKEFQPLYLENRLNYDTATCIQLAEEAAQRINTANAQKKLTWFKSEAEKLELPVSLPKGICHCDFHFSNVLFNHSKFRALIDFDDANYTYFLFDLAAFSEVFSPDFHHETWQNFSPADDIFDFSTMQNSIAIYEQIRPLTAAEKEHFFDVYKLMILFDCIWYFERGDADDFYERRKITHLNQLGREEFSAALFNH